MLISEEHTINPMSGDTQLESPISKIEKILEMYVLNTGKTPEHTPEYAYSIGEVIILKYLFPKLHRSK